MDWGGEVHCWLWSLTLFCRSTLPMLAAPQLLQHTIAMVQATVEGSLVAEAMALGEAMEVPGTLGQAIMVAEATAVVVEPTREVDSLLEAMEGVVVMADDTPRPATAPDLAALPKSSSLRL